MLSPATSRSSAHFTIYSSQEESVQTAHHWCVLGFICHTGPVSSGDEFFPHRLSSQCKGDEHKGHVQLNGMPLIHFNKTKEAEMENLWFNSLKEFLWEIPRNMRYMLYTSMKKAYT